MGPHKAAKCHFRKNVRSVKRVFELARAGPGGLAVTDAVITVRVTPRASRDEVLGWREDELRVRLKAPPVEGKANEALQRLLAKRLGVRASDVEITGGATSRSKRVRIAGLTEAEVRAG